MISVAPILTESGKDLLIRCIGGEQIVFTRFKIGNGELRDTDPKTLTDLLNTTLEFPIAKADTSQEGYIQLSGDFTSSSIESDFYWRELGIFARGENGIETLYAYAYDQDNASLVKADMADIVLEQNVNVIVAIGTGTNVTAVISKSSLYASKADFDQHVGADNPHKISAKTVGLEKVPNVNTNDQTPTYTVPASLQALVSGEKISIAFGKIARAVQNLISHLNSKQNPHGVTAEQVSAAAKTHNHSTSDINSGTLSITRGGTGAGDAAKARANLGAAAKSRSQGLIVGASAWTGDGPYTATVTCTIATASNNLVVGIGGTLTEEQHAAVSAAMIVCTAQAASSITLTAFGDKPEIELPLHVLEVG